MTNLIEEVANSIYHNLDDWTLGYGNSSLTHKSGVKIWWSLDKDEKIPNAGNMSIDTTGEEPQFHRYLKKGEETKLWKAIVRKINESDVVDEEILKRLNS